jgi:hypothetical protein
MNALLAINWEPELRGILIVIIAASTLCGSVYLVLGTNLGARLGFIVAFTGLAGWMALMGSIWWIYGIGLKGPEPSWEAIPGKTVIQDTSALRSAGVLDDLPTIPDDGSFAEEATLVDQQFVDEGWSKIAESEPTFGQAGSSAGELLVETDTFATGEFRVVSVFDTGGERYPKIGDKLDFIAFFHKPHYAVVEVAPLEQLRAEPGRAPTPPEIDTTRQHQYVYMVRDLGARRQPAALITLGSTTVFLLLCWMLHRRDRYVAENRSRQLVAAG